MPIAGVVDEPAAELEEGWEFVAMAKDYAVFKRPRALPD
jgi:hypothetical protein